MNLERKTSQEIKMEKIDLYHKVGMVDIPSLFKRFEGRAVTLQFSNFGHKDDLYPWSVTIETDDQEILSVIKKENQERSDEMSKSFLA